MKLSLVVLSPGKLHGQVLPVRSKGFLIGRAAGCHLRAASDRVSRHHCLLRAEGDRAFVRDLGSTNTTRVNGERIRGEKLLGDGDRLEVGPLAFEVRVHAAVPVDRPTPLPPGKGDRGRTTDNHRGASRSGSGSSSGGAGDSSAAPAAHVGNGTPAVE